MNQKVASGATRRRIAIFFPFGCLDSVPCLCNLVERLVSEGFAIDAFTAFAGSYAEPHFGHGAVRLFPGYGRWAPYGLYRFLPRQRFLAYFGLRRAMAGRYHCLIGVDPEGLIDAAEFNRYLGVPVVYLSLELLLKDDLRDAAPSVLRLKERETELSRHAALVVIQDEQRAALLMADNGVDGGRIALLPNSPLAAPAGGGLRHWHRLFGLAPEIRVALFAGEVSFWSRIGAIVREAGNWPEPWRLVVHSRQDLNRSLMGRVLRDAAPPGKVCFSFQPLAREELGAAIAGADAGLACYWPAPDAPDAYRYQRNMTVIGKSSGKAAYMLRESVPIVTTSCCTLSDLVRRHECGAVVDGPEQIGAALAGIGAAYERYTRHARHAFEVELAPESHLDTLVARLEVLA